MKQVIGVSNYRYARIPEGVIAHFAAGEGNRAWIAGVHGSGVLGLGDAQCVTIGMQGAVAVQSTT
jgi:hypothetical protein